MPSYPANNGRTDTDVEAILNTITATSQTLLTQVRSSNNNIAQMLITMNHMQSDLAQLIRSLDSTRERRYEEEINVLEHQMSVIQQQLEEKKTAKADTRDTSDKVIAIMEKEAQKNRIDWKSVRQTMVNAVFGAIAVGIVWGIISNLHIIGLWIKTFFGR